MLGFMRFVFTAALMLVIGMLALDKAGEYLVIDQPIHADVIVVLAGDRNDRRFFRGLDLLHQGYAPHILVDANSDVILFGQTPAALQNDWIRRIGLTWIKRVSARLRAIRRTQKPARPRSVYTLVRSMQCCW